MDFTITMVRSLIVFVGFKGSGKDTASDYLIQNLGYTPFSFAGALKDSLAAIFCWDRELLEGKTPESREWRETVDTWWADRLGIPDFTPRYAMTNIGTDLFRDQFHNNVWVLSMERRVSMLGEHSRVLFVDGRFPNELSLGRKLGGTVVRVRSGPEPEWYDIARRANFGDPVAGGQMKNLGVHRSEWAWIGQRVDHTIDNDKAKGLDAFYREVRRVCSRI